MFIKPITIRLVAFGQKANVAALRTRAAAMLKEEHGKADPAAFQELSAEAAHDEIARVRRDTEAPLKKATPAQVGLAMTLAEVNERMAVEWLNELPAAKTCVVLATWTGSREPLAWQMLISEGDRTTDSRAV